MEMTGITLNHVPYKGTAPGLADVIAGHVQLCFDAIPPALPHVRSGRTGRAHNNRAADITGARSASMHGWRCLFAMARRLRYLPA